jgi:hypothetical protein
MNMKELILSIFFLILNLPLYSRKSFSLFCNLCYLFYLLLLRNTDLSPCPLSQGACVKRELMKEKTYNIKLKKIRE